jgi:ATP-dependent helicase Lhr and Lhr-like helicase
MLISTRTDHTAFLANIQAVVVDEIHAIAGDDRGWHLLSILERLTEIAGREIQRVGLSATVGNPENLLQWLSGHCDGDGDILMPSAEKQSANTDITIDYVGSLDNAALILSKLYLGEKRLVYCDNRSGVEQLAAALRKHQIKTYVSHSSLSTEERQRSEYAFNNEKDCIIIATSTLELGIDIGDLDRVIQIDAPAAVSSFLQRLGRSGRRDNTQKNCLFLATSEQSLLKSAGIIDLWCAGYVEPIIPPPAPYHVLVQQMIGLILQEKGIGINTWRNWIDRIPMFKKISKKDSNAILSHMIKKEILSQDQGIIWLGSEGETLYGYKNFMEICSTFISPPLFKVRYGNNVIGYVDEVTFAGHGDEQIILLAGKGWAVKQIYWDKKIADVEPSALAGKSSWLGAGPLWSKEVCGSIKTLLSHDETSKTWSNRAVQKISDLRIDFDWVQENATGMIQENNKTVWWTFAGKLANMNISNIIKHELGTTANPDNLSIRIEGSLTKNNLERLRQIDLDHIAGFLARSFLKNHKTAYKFHQCLPEAILLEMIKERFISLKNIGEILNQNSVWLTN